MTITQLFIHPSLSINGRGLRVLRYNLSEALFEVSLLSCEVVEDGAGAPDPSELVGQSAELSLERSDGQSRRTFVGRVIEAERVTDQDDIRSTHLLIAPSLHRLTKSADCRIFRDLSVPDIAKQVLEGAGVAGDAQEWRLTETYAARVHTAQYRETDLDFLLRLLSEEGIYFAVHFKDGRDLVVLSDNPSGLGEIEGGASLSYIAEMGFHGAVDRIFRASHGLAVRPDRVSLRDYDPEHPKLKLEAIVEGRDPGPHALEVFQYPGRFTDPDAGQRLAQVLLDSMQAERDRVTGETGTLRLAPGLRFSLEEHPYEPLNRELLVTAIKISGSTPRLGALGASSNERGEDLREMKYVCEFTAVPVQSTSYRPPRRPRERVVPGGQSVITTGASGEEIHTDDLGRVKSRYHWDRSGINDDRASRWIRTSQIPTGGSMLLPRVGWELNVRHLEGDVDQPVAMGRLYNALTPPPYPLPENKARSSIQTATTPGAGSSNEIRMNDSQGREEMFWNGSKDMTIDVKNNTTESVGNNAERKVAGGSTKNVTNSSTSSVGSNQTLNVAGNQSVRVETFKVDDVAGDHALSIGGNRTMMIGGDHRRDVGGDASLSVGGMQVDLVVGAVTENTLGSLSHTVGAALIDLTAGDRSVLVAGDRTETAGAAKVIACRGGRGVEVGGPMTQKVGGAIINSASGDKIDAAAGTYTEMAAGAQLVKASDVTFEAQGMLSIVMGASTLTLTPGAVIIGGVQVKLDGETADTAVLVMDN